MTPKDDRIRWLKSLPYLLLFYALPFAAIWTGAHWYDWLLCAALCYGRMFFVSAFLHRYFSHRGYDVSRRMQFLMAACGTLAVQQGPIWWAAVHRHHHKYSDLPEDAHSPKQKGFWWAHMGWILSDKWVKPSYANVKDLTKFPELVWLDKHPFLIPIAAGLVLLLVGGWGTLLIGGLLSTTLLYQTTYLVNSLSHMIGKRRFKTADTSRNNRWIAVLTWGEGWHNNHHHYQATANNGFFKGEIDPSYRMLRIMARLGLVRNLRTPPPQALTRNRLDLPDPETAP